MRKQYPTLYGGCLTIFYNLQLATVWYLQLYAMLKYQNNSNSLDFTKADLNTVFKFSEMESYPKYEVLYQRGPIPKYSMEICWEFEGDCLKFT